MTEPPFPEPLDDDDDDVAWALQTAKVQWTRGGHADALVWLGRAADSADRLGNVWRANDLRRMAAELSASSSAAPAVQLPLPQWDAGDDVDDLMGNEESGITSIPPPAIPHQPPFPYETVDDFEVGAESFEGEVVQQVSVITDTPHDPVAQLLGTSPELTDEVEMGDELELTSEVEVIDDDVIDDDALSVEAPPYEESADDPVTQPLIDDRRFLDFAQRSPLPPPRSSLPLPSSSLPLPRSSGPARPSPPVNVLEPGHVLLPRFPSPRVPTPTPVRIPPLKATLPGPLPTPPPPPAPEPEGDPEVGGVLLGEVRGLEDVPPEGQVTLAREATIERLANEEQVSSFGLALVLRGSVNVMPAIADLSCARAAKSEIIWSQGNLEDGIALRLVAAEDGTEVAVWDSELVKSTVRDYPWVLEDLKTLADRFQALAGVAMGPMGERLDDSLRGTVTQRCEMKRLLPGETLTTKGQPLGGMYIMAAGRLEIVEGDAVESELGPGDFLFGAQVLSNGKAPHDSRAGKGGALVLFATRAIAHDLLLSVPPLLEIFAS